MSQFPEAQRVQEKTGFFRKSQVWPIAADLQPDAWLRNFRQDEQHVALRLLDAFCYFAADLTTRILASRFHSISATIIPPDIPVAERKSQWEAFLTRVVLTYPTDEQPGATDSGRSYLRKARGMLNLDERQFADPLDALERLANDPDTPVIFIDDFVGTGAQFLETWTRKYRIGNSLVSFSDFAQSQLHYIPILATSESQRRLSTTAPSLNLRPGHVLDDSYSALDANSLVWYGQEQQEGIQVLRDVSERAGIPIGDGSMPDDWCGFGELGLCVALDDTIPDASLTVFYWEQNGWRPLKRRP